MIGLKHRFGLGVRRSVQRRWVSKYRFGVGINVPLLSLRDSYSVRMKIHH